MRPFGVGVRRRNSRRRLGAGWSAIGVPPNIKQSFSFKPKVWQQGQVSNTPNLTHLDTVREWQLVRLRLRHGREQALLSEAWQRVQNERCVVGRQQAISFLAI